MAYRIEAEFNDPDEWALINLKDGGVWTPEWENDNGDSNPYLKWVEVRNPIGKRLGLESFFQRWTVLHGRYQPF